MDEDCGSVTGSDLLRDQDKTEALLDVPSNFRWGKCIKDQQEVIKTISYNIWGWGRREERSLNVMSLHYLQMNHQCGYTQLKSDVSGHFTLCQVEIVPPIWLLPSFIICLHQFCFIRSYTEEAKVLEESLFSIDNLPGNNSTFKTNCIYSRDPQW